MASRATLPPAGSAPTLADLLKGFATRLTDAFGLLARSAAESEANLAGPVKDFVKAASELITERRLDVVDQPHHPTGTIPDLGVLVDRLLVGHIEIKRPGKGARPERYSGHDKEQWKRLAHHPNLVYTDGSEWSLWRKGERVCMARLSGDPTTDGAAAIAAPDSLAIETLLRNFLGWQPLVPSTPRDLATALAPLCRLLADTVEPLVTVPGNALQLLADTWRETFFPDATAAQFADSYAQTLVYTLLLARVEARLDLDDARQRRRFAKQHALLAQVYEHLVDTAVRREIDPIISLVERTVAAVDPTRWAPPPRLFTLPPSTTPRAALAAAALDDPWLYFYEDFLAAYDPVMRKQRGVYYTPAQVVSAQVALVDELLHDRFDKAYGLVDDGVTLLDPAAGTGTYLLAALERGLHTTELLGGEGARAARARQAAEQFYGFEILLGPYTVARLRLAQKLSEAASGNPRPSPNLYAADTLSSPNLPPPRILAGYDEIGKEREAARLVKRDTPILVCIGNPPYHRKDGDDRFGGWVRYGDDDTGGKTRGILKDFLRGVKGLHAKNLYNLYVYFWRFAIWKVLDSHEDGDEPHDRSGIVSFITSASYLRGPGFVGMRRTMREAFDELWFIDLGGEGRGARRSENVFAIQTPVVIAVGVAAGPVDRSTPAKAHYCALEGTTETKLDILGRVEGFDSFTWESCSNGWEDPFLPESVAAFTTWPLLTDLFPWQHSGVQFKRTWPIAPSTEPLVERWNTLMAAPLKQRSTLLRETPARTVTSRVEALPPSYGHLPTMEGLTPDSSEDTKIAPYGYRSFDRQYALADPRLCDRPRPSLWLAHGPKQVYLTSLLTGLLGSGPAATVTALIPDLHHFSGRGGKDVIPLWRDSDATEPNVAHGLLDLLGTAYGDDVPPEDFFSYCYAILASPHYVERFAKDLEVPGPRIPLTTNADLFRRCTEAGQTLICLHTYGQRCWVRSHRTRHTRPGRAKWAKPASVGDYPNSYHFDPTTGVLTVGAGEVKPVTPEVFDFSVSGFPVVRSWLDYRMRSTRGRTSSPLDEMRPEMWTATFDKELLELLWLLEATLEKYADLAKLLDDICAGPLLPASALDAVDPAQRAAPRAPSDAVTGTMFDESSGAE